MQPNEVDIWVDIKEKIDIGGRTYYLKRVTRLERYNELINKIIDFCEYAKGMVIMYIGHYGHKKNTRQKTSR